MTSITPMFFQGGVWSYVVAATGVIAIGLSLTSIAFNFLPDKRQNRLALIMIALFTLGAIISSFSIAGIGYYGGTIEAWEASEAASPEARSQVLAYGVEIATVPLRLAVFLNSIPLIIGLFTLVRGIRTPKEKFTPPANVFD